MQAASLREAEAKRLINLARGMLGGEDNVLAVTHLDLAYEAISVNPDVEPGLDRAATTAIAEVRS